MAIKEDRPKKPAELPPVEEHTKKRRKVNHACIYCRRSHMTCDLERPCARCIKRSIGHLCHDEPREDQKSKQEHDPLPVKDSSDPASMPFAPGLMGPPLGSSSSEQSLLGSCPGDIPLGMNPANLTQTVPPSQQGSDMPANMQAIDDSNQQYLGYGNWGLGNQGSDQELNNLCTPYMFNAPDIGSEYNVLNNFLNTSLLDESNVLSGVDAQFFTSDQTTFDQLGNTADGGMNESAELAHSASAGTSNQHSADVEGSTHRSRSIKPQEKEEEKYYMTIADPSGNDKPEERMRKLLEAKFKAGLLRPFNYIQGYARLNAYLEDHMQPALRQKMMRHIEKFRPKFRERMQSLTDMELTMVEMWFEKTLMEYDRVFASMAVPACCWRRTGEIFRGNKAMAELIRAPVDKLRDGQLALHEIMAERDLVSYWDNFLAIAFDNSQKAILTTCNLKSQDPKDADIEIKCCFSFTVRRDAQHNIPSLIVGNFLPQIERKT